MGSTGKMTEVDEKIFKLVTRYFYPEGYKFGSDEHDIFDMGVFCAGSMVCPDLSKLDLTTFTGYTIKEARKELEIDTDVLKRYYKLEKEHYNAPESQRLI